MSTRHMRLPISPETFDAFHRMVDAANRLHEGLHRAGIHFTRTPGRIKRARAHVARCHLCNPAANPKPLTIDGHEYTRRRNGRKGK